jgi:hypothetical protein
MLFFRGSDRLCETGRSRRRRWFVDNKKEEFYVVVEQRCYDYQLRDDNDCDCDDAGDDEYRYGGDRCVEKMYMSTRVNF